MLRKWHDIRDIPALLMIVQRPCPRDTSKHRGWDSGRRLQQALEAALKGQAEVRK
jgi:hypothetical protein